MTRGRGRLAVGVAALALVVGVLSGQIGRPSDLLVWLTMAAELGRRLSAGPRIVRGSTLPTDLHRWRSCST